MTQQDNATKLEKIETIKSTEHFINQYEKQYNELLVVMANSCGATLQMAADLELLKERFVYFRKIFSPISFSENHSLLDSQFSFFLFFELN